MSVRFVSAIILCLSIKGLALADTRLGGSIGDFRTSWGRPTHQEILVRTATFKWNEPRVAGRPIAPSIWAAEVAFLDGRACEIVLRSHAKVSRSSLYGLVKPFLDGFKGTKMPKPKSDFPNSTVYKLSNHTFVLINKMRGEGDVIVIMDACYSQNQEVFDREAAKVRPPTPNH